MRLLILGGTGWLGGAIARSGLAAGHSVTCVARGDAAPDGVRLIQADRDHDDALWSVVKEHWDAVVDVAPQPGHVRRACRDLGEGAGRFVFVSSVSAYASHAELDAHEDAALLEPFEGDSYTSPEDYGAAKVAGEEAVLGAFGPDRAAVVRPGLIGGPGDPSGRSTYWPHRFAHPSSPSGEALVPDAPNTPTAVIDARDLARWIVRLTEGRASGVFNAMGAAYPLGDHLAAARAVAGHTGRLMAASPSWLTTRGVAQWAGPRSLPLWIHDPQWHGMNARSNARALAAGLELRPLEETLRDALAAGHAGSAGLSDIEERELLAALFA